MIKRLQNYKRRNERWVKNRSSLKNNKNFHFFIHFVHFEVNTFYPIDVLSTSIFTDDDTGHESIYGSPFHLATAQSH